MCVLGGKYSNVRAKGRLIPLQQGLSLNLKFIISAVLAEQRASRLYLSPLHSSGACSHACYFYVEDG